MLLTTTYLYEQPRVLDQQVHETIVTDDALEDFMVANNPTCGRCPFCRRCINLFDIKNETQGFVYEKRYHIWNSALSGMSFEEDRMKTMLLEFPNEETAYPKSIISFDPNRKLNLSFDQGCFFHEKTNLRKTVYFFD